MDWIIWRVVLAKIATLQEIEEHWSFSDLLDAHEALDYQDDMQTQIRQEMEKRIKK